MNDPVKQEYQEPIVIGSKIDVAVTKSEKNVSYKTKLEFIDNNKGKRVVVSVVAPQITQAGMLQFLQEDRMVSYPLNVIFSFEVELLTDLKPSGIAVSIKEKS